VLFRGQALHGSDLSNANRRGVDFTSADLQSASFRDARVGALPWISAAIPGAAMVAAVGACVLIGLSVEGTTSRLSSDEKDQAVVGGTAIVRLVVLVAVIL